MAIPMPAGPPTTRPVVGELWQPPLPADNPLDAEPLT